MSFSICDSHAHLISDDPGRYPLDPADGVSADEVLRDPMTVERLLRELDGNGVRQALLVQRGTVYGFDNRYVCDSAQRYRTRLHAVCAIDARRADCGEIARGWAAAGAVGFRVMEPRRGSDLSWLWGDAAASLWRTAASLGLPVCVHLFPWNRVQGLAAIEAALAEYPALDVVIDHFSNVAIDAAGQPQLDEALRRIAAHPHGILKFTTIPLGRLAGDGIDAMALLTAMVGLFGADRLMWGSDIAQSTGTYAEMVGLGRAAVRHLSSADQAAILGGTARRVYRLPG